MASTALALLDPEPLIAQIANGAYLRDLATQTGIDKRRLSEVLRKHPDYAVAKEVCHEGRLDDAEEAIVAASEQADVARARAQWSAVSWRAERECPARWGQRTHVTLDVTVELGDRLRRSRERVVAEVQNVQRIEHDPLNTGES